MKRLIKVLKYTMITLIALMAVLSLVTIIYLRQPVFGAAANGARLEKMKRSVNYKDGSFTNRKYTPMMTEGYSMTGVMFDFLFKKNPRQKPSEPIPHVKTDLKSLPADSNLLVWFGHSSYYIQLNGMKILVDPVFSGNASPVNGTTRAFDGTNTYGADDLPDIDLLLISHDHYDHLDHTTIKALKGRVKKVIAGLGVGAHFESWGYAPEVISEHDWDETVELTEGFKVHTLTARHFSGRTFKRNTTLWMSYMLETPEKKIYIGGDSGYDVHFAQIGQRFGSVDLAILENGQYNVAWQAIHCLPEEVVAAGKDLHAKRVMPVHSGKFSLAQHSWDEPFLEVSKFSKQRNLPLVTPVIGEIVWLDNEKQEFREWWKDVR